MPSPSSTTSNGEPRSLQSLRHGIRRCRRCRLHQVRTHAVPGEGPAGAPVMLIGEAPGAREDETGLPFQGMAGRFLDAALAEAGLERATLYITSAVKCRPPKNRNPGDDELEACREAWLRDQVAAANPELILLAGAVPARATLGKADPVRRLRNRSHRFEGIRARVTYHPAAAMRFPTAAKGFREDLARIAKRFGTG